MEFAADRTAVVVVDMQKGFCHPEGSLHSPGSEAVVEPIAGLLDDARAAGTSVVFTRDVHPEGQFEGNHYYDEFDRWGEHVVEGTWETAIVDGLDVHPEDHVLTKHTYDAFHRTELAGWLDAHGIDDLVFCGTLANVCVFYTATSAGIRDYRPLVVEDALGYVKEKHKQYAVNHIEWLFGEKTTVGELEFV